MRVLLDLARTYQRSLFIATALFLVAGCGSDKLDKPLPAAQRHIQVAAPWREGAQIPRRYTCDGAGEAPHIRVTRAGGTRPHALVMTDPDAPGGTFVHWTRWDGVDGKNSFGKKGYSGPCPPKGDDPHRYVITVYELTRPLGLPAGADADSVVAAIRERVAATGSIAGRYGR